MQLPWAILEVRVPQGWSDEPSRERGAMRKRPPRSATRVGIEHQRNWPRSTPATSIGTGEEGVSAHNHTEDGPRDALEMPDVALPSPTVSRSVTRVHVRPRASAEPAGRSARVPADLCGGAALLRSPAACRRRHERYLALHPCRTRAPLADHRQRLGAADITAPEL